MLRCFQAGLSIADLERLSYGMVIDIFTEAQNDSYEYTPMATQADIDKF